MRYLCVILAFILIILGGACSKKTTQVKPEGKVDEVKETVTATLSKEISRPWIGLGYNQYPLDRSENGEDLLDWDPVKWNLTMQRIDAIKPALVRIPIYRDWCNPTGVVGTYDWESKKMKSFYKVLEYYQQKSIPIMTGFWSESINGSTQADFYQDAGPTGFTQLQIDFLKYLIQVKGFTNIKWYTPTNEPKGTKLTFSQWSVGIKNLYKALIENNLSHVKLTGSDSWQDWTPLAAQHNSPELDSYEQHYYLNLGEQELISGQLYKNFSSITQSIKNFDNSNKPIFLGEVGFTSSSEGTVDYWYKQDNRLNETPITSRYGLFAIDFTIQMASSGMGGALAWCLDGFDYGKDSGMWQVTGKNGGMSLRPWYYSWSLLCRSLPEGGTIYPMTLDKPNLRAMAFKKAESADKAKWTFVIINHNDIEHVVKVNVPGWGSGNFSRYTYSMGANVDGTSLRLPEFKEVVENMDKGFTIKVPAKAGVIFTSIDQKAITANGK